MRFPKVRFLLLITVLVLVFASVAYAYNGPAFSSRILSYGMVGGDVQVLQDFLNTHGIKVGNTDGIFGDKVFKGVKFFQNSNGLVGDGVVGSKTFALIKRIKSGGAVPVGGSTGSSQGNAPAPSGTPLAAILKSKGISGRIPSLKIVVDKSDHMLTLYSGNTALKSYKVSLGEGGLGDKKVSGDHKTPSGTYYISERSVLTPQDQYLGTRWMRVSYPNIADAQRGLDTGLISKATYNQIVDANNRGVTPPQKTALGGGVGIHGGTDNNGPGKDWTWGCVGLFNKDVNEIFDYIYVGTKLVIKY